jgi:hypothetical protein
MVAAMWPIMKMGECTTPSQLLHSECTRIEMANSKIKTKRSIPTAGSYSWFVIDGTKRPLPNWTKIIHI